MNIEINKPNITLDTALEHGISSDEWKKIKDHLGRTPNFTELGIFSAMWNEHCSYKSSKIHLKKFPTKRNFPFPSDTELIEHNKKTLNDMFFAHVSQCF